MENNQQKYVAVKVVKRDESNADQIEREIQILKKINHPNVVNFIN